MFSRFTAVAAVAASASVLAMKATSIKETTASTGPGPRALFRQFALHNDAAPVQPVLPVSDAEAAATAALEDKPEVTTPPPPPAPPANPYADAVTLPGGNLRAKYVLVGTGTASYSAAAAIMERDPTAVIIMIGEDVEVPYARPPITKELWFSQDPDVVDTLNYCDWAGNDVTLHYQPPTYYTSLKAKGDTPIVLLNGVRAVDLDLKQRFVLLADGRKVFFDQVLLATGGTPATLPAAKALPEHAKQHVTTLRTVADYRKLYTKLVGDAKATAAAAVAATTPAEGAEAESAASAPTPAAPVAQKHVVVIGGSFLGSEVACALAQQRTPNGEAPIKVTQVFPEEGNMGRVFPRYLTNWTTGKMRQLGIDIRSKSLLAEKAGLELDEKRGGILVNAELEARSGVFAAGDVTSFHDIALGRRRIEHYDHAVLTGRVAGENMTGARSPYSHQSMFWSDLGPKIGYEAIGILDPALTTVGIWAKGRPSDTPQAATSAGDNIRSAVADPSKLSASSVADDAAAVAAAEASQVATPPPPPPAEHETYGKGVVFYLNKRRQVVGMLLWNNFGQVGKARNIILEGREWHDLTELARLFKVNE
ncbi:hypothetical protein H696_00226 [Fonticula alba]|uniref:FAD/NAD(P)-binding domain-containing protein n=1 Tax=Fonticula alba TaxID=691883 RepID=A0A058ZE20_FONAL|nr:hypothetical protein H696_00226 [Fonticula alba]KCV72645.1 hypothetical protein H696_00226 [Fonticula alba]|eukprot:XP_009492346.1 hypothetical protein H696_00226 [Fonticula alba]